MKVPHDNVQLEGPRQTIGLYASDLTWLKSCKPDSNSADRMLGDDCAILRKLYDVKVGYGCLHSVDNRGLERRDIVNIYRHGILEVSDDMTFGTPRLFVTLVGRIGAETFSGISRMMTPRVTLFR